MEEENKIKAIFILRFLSTWYYPEPFIFIVIQLPQLVTSPLSVPSALKDQNSKHQEFGVRKSSLTTTDIWVPAGIRGRLCFIC